MRHSSWRAYSRIGFRWLGVSALVGGRVFCALASAGGISVTSLPLAVLAVELIAVEDAHAEHISNTSAETPSPDAPSQFDDVPASDDTNQPLPDATPVERLPPGGWQSEPTNTKRK